MTDKLLITIDFAPNTGGVARYLSGYAKKNEFDVLACGKSEGVEENIFRKSLLWRMWPKWLPLLFWGFLYSRKYKEIAISHILPVGYAALLSGKKYTVILHGLDILSAGKNSWKRFWSKMILERADKIIANSKATGELLYKIFGNPYRYEVEYPMIKPMPEGARNPKEKYSLSGFKVILSLGRLVKRKGQEKIIRLMPRILDAVPNAVFLIAGGGEERENLEQTAQEMQLQDRVIFLGKVKEAELPDLYSACDVFVLTALPSKDNWEGFGMVCLEAAYFGKPVVVANVGGLPEAVENEKTGFVVKNDEELLEKIVLLLKDEESAKKMGEEGKRWVNDKFLISNF